ncbi:MAG TPA: cyclase family protein [Candidatus Binatia bacterium]|nr:cyclase family protein [Candidatus Binatia bacterium]
MTRALFALTLSVLACAAQADALDEKKLVDLTYPFSSDTHHWPTAKPFQFEKVAEGRTPGGFWYSSYNYGGSEHVGTHLDAPFHFAEGKWTTEQVPLSRLIGPALVIDMRRQAEMNSDYALQVSDVHAWEKSHGRIPRDSIILIRSGWGKHWGDRKRYFGTDEAGNVKDLHFPGLSKEAAEFLVKQRGVKAVGIDTPSIDPGPSNDFLAHQVLGAANVPIFENVAALERMPARGATVYAIPMKIKGGSGAPLRIFAILP